MDKLLKYEKVIHVVGFLSFLYVASVIIGWVI